MKEKKKLPILIGILLVAVAITIGTTFAVWQLTLQQESTNVITTGCFQVTFTDNNPINLEKAYPLSDEEGASLIPYSFTITNTCDNKAAYQINLETLTSSTLTDRSMVKIMLNNITQTGTSKFLINNATVPTTLTDADTSYKLETDILNPKEAKTYHLRMWLDENTPTEDIYMNKSFQSKITIITSYLAIIDEEVPFANFTVTKSSNGIEVDASSSTDNMEIKKYYYSLDGLDYVEKTANTHTFETESLITYGQATDTIVSLVSNQPERVFVKVEDGFGNMSAVVSKSIEELIYDGSTGKIPE